MSSSPSAPTAGATIALILSDSTTGEVIKAPSYVVTSAPPDSKLQLGSAITRLSAPSGEVVYAASNNIDGFTTSLAEAVDYWAGATLKFSTGRLAGVSRAIVKTGAVRIGVNPHLPFAPDPGDAFSLALQAGDTRARAHFVPDVPGEYVIGGHSTVDLYAPGGTDPGSSIGRTRIIRDVQSTTINVAEVVDLPIVPTNGHGATLRLKVANDTIVAALLVSPLTEIARAAILDSGIQSALSAMVGETVDTVGNALQATANDLLTKYELHRVKTSGSTHATADSVNLARIDPAFDDDSAIKLTNRMRDVLYSHMTGSSAAGARWHTADDTKNVPMLAQARTKGEATVLLAELTYRVYPGHLAQIAAPSAHGAADATNTIAVAKSDLSEIVRVYLNFIAQTAPTIPAGLPDGATTARSRYGFVKAF